MLVQAGVGLPPIMLLCQAFDWSGMIMYEIIYIDNTESNSAIYNAQLIAKPRVTLIVGLSPKLTSLWIISSQILHFLRAWQAGWNN